MKIKPLKLLLAAAPAIGGVIAGPVGAVITALGMGAAGAVKKGGKVVEKKTGKRPQKLLAPATVIGLPALLSPLLNPESVDAICAFVDKVCDNPGAVLGLIGWFVYYVTTAIGKTAGPAKE